MRSYTIDDLAQLVDHTNLRADATREDMERLCDEARRHHFRMVAVNSGQSARCAALLAGTDVHVGAAIGFPLGQQSVATKEFETRDALGLDIYLYPGVSPEGWAADDNGWRYRRADGSFITNATAEIGGRQYTFDGSGYAEIWGNDGHPTVPAPGETASAA